MNLQGARDYIIHKLETELDPFYYYHNAFHTKDVHRAVVYLAEIEHLPQEEQFLLETAAFYHDAGILIKYTGHEEESIRIVKEVLPSFGYTGPDIEFIEGLIMATNTHGLVDTLPKKILFDSDLDYLGRPDYFIIAQRLRLEWNILGENISLRDWYIGQVKYLENHAYLTDSAFQMRNKGKLENLNQIKELLSL